MRGVHIPKKYRSMIYKDIIVSSVCLLTSEEIFSGVDIGQKQQKKLLQNYPVTVHFKQLTLA